MTKCNVSREFPDDHPPKRSKKSIGSPWPSSASAAGWEQGYREGSALGGRIATDRRQSPEEPS